MLFTGKDKDKLIKILENLIDAIEKLEARVAELERQNQSRLT